MKRFDHIDGLHKIDFERLQNFQITEKLDGANFRWKLNRDGTISFGSRNVDFIENDLRDFSRFTPYIEYVTKQIKGRTITDKFYDFIFFGEAMIHHTLSYELKDDLVYGFAIYDTVKDEYIEDWDYVFSKLGIPTVHIYFEKAISPSFIKNPIFHEQLSHIDNKTPVEGYVLFDYKNQYFVKYKTKKYLNKVGIRGKKSKFSRYLTTDRIDNIITHMELSRKYDVKNPVRTFFMYLAKDIYEDVTESVISKIVIKHIINDITQNINKDVIDEVNDKFLVS